MEKNIEIEYKILITKEIYQQLLKDFKPTTSYQQTNHYFFHPILKQKHYALRVREKNNTYEFTLKRPYNNHILESNIMIDKNDFLKLKNHQVIHNEIIDILQNEGIDIPSITCLTSLTTLRHDIKLDYGTLSIDYNTYNNQEDYELEYEVFDEKKGYEHFLNIIHTYQLDYTKNCESKIQRALKSGSFL